jgi:succinate dehydrogenase subunit D
MARSNEPLWWGPFSAGMMVGALFVPALIVITGLFTSLGIVSDPEQLRGFLRHPLTRILLFVVISLSFFHWAHRFRYILFDLGMKGGKMAVATVCYGLAIVGTVVAGVLAVSM